MKLSEFPRAVADGSAMRAVLSRVRKLGIDVQPYYVFREGDLVEEPERESGFEDYEVGFLTADDISEVARCQGSPPEKFGPRLSKGHQCFGIKMQGRVIAFMWCDYEEFNHVLHPFRLEEGEAYLYAAFVDPTFRGKGLAPLMRRRCYRALEARDKHTYYSYSDFFNRPAVRFKKKLGAQFLRLHLHVSLWKRWSWNVVLRDYQGT